MVSSEDKRAVPVAIINRGVTGRTTACQPLISFPLSVYIGIRLFVLLGKCPGDVSPMPWKVRRTLVSWANNSVGTQSCPTNPALPPRHAPRTVPPEVCPGFGLDRLRLKESQNCSASQIHCKPIFSKLWLRIVLYRRLPLKMFFSGEVVL